jgi:hypothetical protein
MYVCSHVCMYVYMHTYVSDGIVAAVDWLTDLDPSFLPVYRSSTDYDLLVDCASSHQLACWSFRSRSRS